MKLPTDELFQGDIGGVVQLRHDGRLPLQVLGDVVVLDLVKCRHLQSDVVGQVHVVKGGWGHLVVGELKNHLLIIATII